MDVQTLRAEAFKALHERDGAFVIPNPWDAGSARMLASLGFEALATTSAGLAFSLGRPDAEGALTPEETLDNARAIVDATPLPVAADLENGFGDLPEDCARTIQRAGEAGLVGGSIEDASGRSDAPIYDFELSVARVRAAVAALGATAAAPPGPDQLEGAVLERSRPRRTFRRLSADRLAGILGVDKPSPPPAGVAESPDLPVAGGEVP